MGLVPPLPFDTGVFVFRPAGCSAAGFLWRALPLVSASNVARSALLLMVLLLGFALLLYENAQNILVDLQDFSGALPSLVVFLGCLANGAGIPEHGPVAEHVGTDRDLQPVE